MMIVVYRVGSHIVLPGINPVILASSTNQNASNGILDLINTFAGGAFNMASIFAYLRLHFYATDDGTCTEIPENAEGRR